MKKKLDLKERRERGEGKDYKGEDRGKDVKEYAKKEERNGRMGGGNPGHTVYNM